MYNFSSSFLRLLPPELAHSITINALKFFYFKNKNIDDPILSQHLLGMDFKNPIGLAAGFDKNAEVINQMLSFGFGFVEVGTITNKPQKGNPKPRVFRIIEENSVINHLGFNNKGYKNAKNNLNKIRNSYFDDNIIGINIGKNKDTINSIDDYLFLLEKFGNLSSYITINISSPNTTGLRDLQERNNIEKLIKLINKKRSEIESINMKPILVKISPDLNEDQLRDIALISLANNIDGLILTNTTTDRPKNITNYKYKKGGLSGQLLFKKSNKILKKMYVLTNGQIPLVGVGGISNGSQCYEKIKSGASLVQIYTALIYSGPNLIHQLKNELIDLIKTDGYKNISEVVGKGA